MDFFKCRLILQVTRSFLFRKIRARCGCTASHVSWGVSEAAESQEGAYPHAMDVRESLNAALLVWGLASRLFIRVIKNPTHTKSFSSTGRERAFLRGFRKTRSFQHLLMGVLACLLKNTPSQHGGFVAFCNVSKKMRYELDSQIPGIPGSEYPGRPKWTIRCGIQIFYSGKLMRHG